VTVAAFGNTGDISSVLAGTESGGKFIPTLANNGGPTETIALVVGSPAYLAGGANTGGELDQRGDARGSTISIGAWDYDPALLSPVVTSEADTAGDVIGSAMTLRDALTYANAGVFGADPTLTFATGVGEFDGIVSSDNTISLAQGELVIDHSVTIDAPSAGVTIDAGGTSRVMEIDGTSSGVTVNLSDLTLENGNGNGTNESDNGGGLLVYAESGLSATVTISNSTISGNSAAYGGGIYNDGNDGAAMLTINNSTISGNKAINDDGGGIYNEGAFGTAMLTINNSTISGNSATDGGGIYNDGYAFGTAMLTISNSTISGNSASAFAGGIYNDGDTHGNATLAISNSTISGNSATDGGGGIFNDGDTFGNATLTIGDTILAGNTAGGSEADYTSDQGSVTDQGYNLYGQKGSDGGFNSGNGVTTQSTDIELGGSISTVLQTTLVNNVVTPELAANGGLTETIALVIGSPAIDAGDPALIGSTDQRGVTRGSEAAGTGLASDIGAYEAAIINVTADNRETVYDAQAAAPTLAYTVVSGPAGDLTGSIAITTPETDAGTYTGDIGQGTLAVTSNKYLLDFTAGTLTIDKRTVTIDPNSGQGKIYGTADPTLLFTTATATGTTGLVNGDMLSGALSYSGADLYTGVGNYAFTTGTLANSNYSVVLEASAPTFDITARTVTIDPTAGQGKVYGSVDPILTYTTETATGTTGLVHGDTLTGALSYAGAGQYTNVGNYAFTTGTLANANYSVVLEASPPTFDITPATLTYVANPATRYVGAANPTFTGMVTGFLDNQSVGSATMGTLTFTTTATSSSPAGHYAIDGSGLTANFGNYVFIQAPGNATALTIAGYPLGQPYAPFFDFSAQFNANANYNSFFTQGWFPLFAPGWNGWLIPVFSPGNEPHPVYSNQQPGYAPGHTPPGGVIAFGSSFTVGSP
jgi:hypothetical protein